MHRFRTSFSDGLLDVVLPPPVKKTQHGNHIKHGVMIRLAKGIELIKDLPGSGRFAAKDDVVIYNARFFLRKGEEVTRDAQSIAMYGARFSTRTIDGVQLIDHTTTLGKRRPIAGVEKTLYGMQPGGYREVLVSPHLCYGEAGVANLIPPNAMLRIQLWVQDVQTAG